MKKIAYLGMGTMGRGMAANLLKAGHQVTVWNRSPERCADLVARGAKQAATPAEAAAGAELVMYCLSDDAAVEDLVWGAGDLLSAVQPGQIVVDMTTLHPSVSLKEAAAYAAKGARFLDAPVFGSKNEAANGGLWIVVGGDKALYEEVKPILEVLSETTHYMGENGKGTSMKLVGNLVVAAQIEALGEAMVLATKAGLDPVDVLGVLHVTDFKSPIFDGVGKALVGARLQHPLCPEADAQGRQPDRPLRPGPERPDSRRRRHPRGHQGAPSTRAGARKTPPPLSATWKSRPAWW